MHDSISDLGLLLRCLDPVLHEGVYVYVSLPVTTDLASHAVLATFREAEGLTVIASEAEAIAAQWPILFRAAWITLTVHSALDAVGLTAAVATALAQVGISCNVVAAAYHDHVFVPVDRAEEAIAVLKGLARHDD